MMCIYTTKEEEQPVTARIETAIAEQAHSPWQKLLAWLTAFEQAMDYDPQEYADAGIKHLRTEVGRLNARLDEFEGRNQPAA